MWAHQLLLKSRPSWKITDLQKITRISSRLRTIEKTEKQCQAIPQYAWATWTKNTSTSESPGTHSKTPSTSPSYHKISVASDSAPRPVIYWISTTATPRTRCNSSQKQLWEFWAVTGKKFWITSKSTKSFPSSSKLNLRTVWTRRWLNIMVNFNIDNDLLKKNILKWMKSRSNRRIHFSRRTTNMAEISPSVPRADRR